MWVKKCVKIRVMLFKKWNHAFKYIYQTTPKFLKFTSIKKLVDKFEEFFTKLIWRDSD